MSQIYTKCLQCGLLSAPGVKHCPRCAHFYGVQRVNARTLVIPTALARKSERFAPIVMGIIMLLAIAFAITHRPEPAWHPGMAELQSVQMYMSGEEVLAIMGAPERSQEMRSMTYRTNYWYYNAGGLHAQIVFEYGHVTSVNHY